MSVLWEATAERDGRWPPSVPSSTFNKINSVGQRGRPAWASGPDFKQLGGEGVRRMGPLGGIQVK
jgi:hypothetical protein